MLDLGLVLIRGPVGVLLAGHGVRKLSRRFGGAGVARTGEAFEALGYRHGAAMAVLAGTTEVAAGLGLAAGAATPLAAAAAIGVMSNATVTAHRGAGLWAEDGGYEYPLVVATVAAGVATLGPGAASVDALVGHVLSGPAWGAVAIGLGLVGAAALLAAERRRPAERMSKADGGGR